MSRRRQIAALTVVTLAVAAVSATGASAKAAKKPAKLKTMKGSYSVTLVPDPTAEVQGELGKNCGTVDPQSSNVHPLTLPGSGTLHVVLDSPDPTKTGNTDWDLVILDSSGSEWDSSTGGTSHEETVDPGMKKGKISIVVCNLAGAPNGNVSYTYTYR
jgi:streptogramin lyase